MGGCWDAGVSLDISNKYLCTTLMETSKSRKLETTNKYIPDVLFECIILLIDKQLNLFLEKEKRPSDNTCEILDVIDNIFKEMN